ncbi:transient receptor potential cation channel protein painless [Eurytemora carolleeae]|uniref:transient receptor potential cation channel protein painless n=1 Tax=Eurytemora carolleeae TaxID=1294199 RepID=UPI000C75F397|nr:transient receptor potential cation channel protein painless [Eurytemora carolleeae]|eukprot:XP_023328482.1 transient receptor potential cation channel protein painless-like [Eurytemora affinis]
MADQAGMGGKFNAQECVRMDSLKCVSKPQEKALLYMQKKDLQGFTDFINTQEVEDGAGELTHWINQPVDEEGANLVEIAVRDGLLGELRALLGCGARIDLVGAGSGLTPLHVAVKHNRNNILKLLIESRPEVDINIVSSSFTGGYTPLHTAAEINNIQALQFILQHDDVDVDAKDIRGSVTPLLLAVKGKHIQAARCLIENGGNLDHKAGPKTIRQHIISDLPDLQLPIEVKRSRALNLEVVDNIFMLLKNTELGSTEYSAQFGQFKTYMSCFRKVSEQDMVKVVYLACEKGLWEHISLLLENKINPDCCPHGILEAGFYGHFKVLEIFKKFGANFGISKEKETLLHRVLRMEYQNRNKEDFEKCLKVLIGNPQDRVGLCMKRLINRMDGFGNTALHYATQYWTQITVRELLELGANIGMKNEWGELPISRIRPDTMEQFLDDFCLTSSGDIVQENFQITFRYDFLAPNEDALPEKFRGRNLEDAKENLIIDKDIGERRAALPETEPLWYMSRSKEHRFLLKHPVITSFLWYKWGRLRTYFNRNLRY